MTPQQTEQAAALLKAARLDNKMLAGLDDGLTPCGMDDGYALQDAFMRIREEPVAGWKVRRRLWSAGHD